MTEWMWPQYLVAIWFTAQVAGNTYATFFLVSGPEAVGQRMGRILGVLLCTWVLSFGGFWT